jgi:NTP pyrophosphatase (non-canonical NTP hydrolase)
MSGMFHFGAMVWPGIAKLIEEAGEVLQITGKLVATRGNSKHWDGSDLRLRLEEEMGDLLAALHFVIEQNYGNAARIRIYERQAEKLRTFRMWHLEGDPLEVKGEDERDLCPSEHCGFCTGEACNKCGAGCWNNDPELPDCDHDVIDRHEGIKDGGA